ncbi:uncharacterized protein [Argopecten irradians]|uniref:uncharacterized protein n=1 Tax=Argopecten irradians TaxID=31199 RepID=UPI00371C47B1
MLSISRLKSSDKQVPLAFMLMSSRRTQDYEAVFQKLKDRVGECQVQGFVLDFEAACWTAVRTVFPDTELKGCSFHWAQAVLRKVGNLGLRPTYDRREGVHQFVKQLLALPFLPAEQIEPAFRMMSARANTPELRDLTAYIDHQWMQSRVWPPVNWSIHQQSVRTNNDVEGWHHRLNGKAGRANLPFYMMVPLLLQEASLVTIQMRLVSQNALQRHQRTTYRRIQGKITELWDDYDADRISTSAFLRRVGHIYAPRPATEQ